MRAARLWLHVFGGGLVLSQVPGPGELRLVSEVRLVVLDVGVRDGVGKPVAGLGREAFRVFDSGRPRPVTNFAAEDAPVTIGLVLDTSGSMRAQRSETIAAAATLVAESRADDELFLVTFGDDVSVVPPAAPAALRRRIEEAVCEGRTALYDGIDAALAQLQKGIHERKAIVILSDGGDTASRLLRADVLDRVRRSPATVYAIGMTGDDDAAERNPGFLREITRVSGGDAHLDVPPARLAELCRIIARDIRSRYMLAFHAAETSKIEIRPIRVEALVPGRGRVRVLSRRHYVASPASQGARP